MQNSNPENIAVANSDAAVTLDTILGWLRHRADGLYGGEAVTQLEHALQCASLAQTAGATPALVIAALLHDLGHLADSGNDEKIPHGKLAARLLSGLFGRDVTEVVVCRRDVVACVSIKLRPSVKQCPCPQPNAVYRELESQFVRVIGRLPVDS